MSSDKSKVVSAGQCKLAARAFNIGSIIAATIPIFVMVWVAASIFVYASVAHHPDNRVREYNRFAGYRFYGVAGTIVVILNFSGVMKDWVGSERTLWLLVWGISFLIIVPLGVWDFFKAGRESWQDIVVQGDAHA
jgi:hypothetical protein